MQNDNDNDKMQNDIIANKATSSALSSNFVPQP